MPPPDPVQQALTTLRAERHVLRLEKALDVLGHADHPGVREALLTKYAQATAQGDSGAVLRSALLRALRTHATKADVPLLEQAARTYEYMPPNGSEVAESLRAAALVTLNEVDDVLAGFHGVRLLFEPAALSGEPALTAARLLATQGQLLPLYRCASAAQGAAEVLAECLRSLTDAPGSIVEELAAAYRDVEDDAVLLGLLDLLLARGGFAEYIAGFLATTRSDGLFQWLAAMIVASRREDLLALLREMAAGEPDRTRRNILRDALALA